MPKKYYSVQNKTDQTADILIYGVIGDSWFEESVTARQFVADLKALEKDFTRINVHINSPGGSVFDGLPIFNALKNSTSDIHTYNDGLCASMAAVILLAGKTVHTADNALIMLHSPISGAYGNAADIQQCLDMLDKVELSLITCISRKGDKTVEEIKALFFDDKKDHWLNADEAQAEGFVDDIVKGDKTVSDKIKNLSHSEVLNQFNSLVKGKSLFNRFFSQAHDFFSPPDSIDMDITILRNACGLAEEATEQDVLDFISAARANATPEEDPEAVAEDETTDPEEEPEPKPEENSEVADKDQEIANLKKQIDNLKGAPGARTKKVVKETDSDKVASDNFETYKSAREMFNTVTSLVK